MDETTGDSYNNPEMLEKLDINIKAAVLWQLQHLVKTLTTGKHLNAALAETEKVSLSF